MASSLSSNEDYESDSDDEMISCAVCMSRYNTSNHKPKFLDCHHYFCLTCIGGLAKGGKTISCPTCRHVTSTPAGRQSEDLSTNNLVLRLLDIKTVRARKTCDMIMSQAAAVVTKKKKLWCVTCSVLSTPHCKAQQHMLCDFSDVLNENLVLIKARAGKCCEKWGAAIEERNRVKQIYSDVLSSLQYLEHELKHRMDLNEKQIDMVEKKKQMSSQMCLGQNSAVENDKNVSKTMDNIKGTVAQLDELEAKHSRFKAHHLLQNLLTVEGNLMYISFLPSRPNKEPVKSIELLKQLKISYSGERYANDSFLKACVSSLSFLILKFAEEQSKRESRSLQQNNNTPSPVQSQRSDNAVLGVKGKQLINNLHSNGNVTNPPIEVPKMSEPTKMSFRDSLIRFPTKTVSSEDWQCVSKVPAKVTSQVSSSSGGIPGKKCYLIFSVDGKLQSRVVIQLEPSLAPIMSAKFKEMCSSNTGYCGSRIFKAYRNEYVMGGSRWFHLSTGETLPIDRKDLFKPDRSEILKKRGSVLFQVKDFVNGVSVVSTEFQILLANRTGYRKTSTVFGQVIEGLDVCDKISHINVVSRTQDRKVIIAECGLC